MQVGSDSMGREINIDSIHDLEEQIEEGTGDIIQLKRARNSLLNISMRVPPEILGFVFRWNIIPYQGRPYFGGLPNSTYNFLLVCHHWFEVASHTPELWSFWGDTLKKWSRRYKRSGTTPVDLVLNTGSSEVSFDGPLQDALRDRATRGAIRSLHLRSQGSPLLASILSALTPDDEGVRCSNIESISLRYVDASKFFARHHFPKLWYLNLTTGVTISSWEDLGLHTTALTTLSLANGNISPIPTTHQLLTIFVSNPRLQNLTLSKHMIPRDNGDGSTIPVPLRHLKRLSLKGNFHLIFQLLHRLDHPETMEEMTLTVLRCAVEDVSGTLGPYVRDYIRRDGRFRDGLGILVNSIGDSISIQASTISNVEGPIEGVTFATFTAMFLGTLPPPTEDRLCIDFVAHTPGEHVLYFGGDLSMDALRGTVAAMPNIRELRLTRVLLTDGFLQPVADGPLANKKLLPSLRRLYLEDILVHDDDWSPLLSYLTHQTSDDQGISLTLSGGRQHICKDVVREIEGLVKELILHLLLDDDCPFDHCSVSEEDEE